MASLSTQNAARKVKSISYAKWGYVFILPFFVIFALFSLVPLISTFYNSFFENYRQGLQQIGPNFVWFDNYVKVFTQGNLLKYAFNTVWIWLLGFIPQILISLLLAVWFTDLRLRLKVGFFKTVIYMPNLIMAAALSMLFFAMFSDNGPVNTILASMGMKEPFRFLSNTASARGLVALMNFLMWFGNTTILLMSGIMGIETSLFEAAQIDGAKPWQMFFKVTLPLLKPILVFVLITSMIGGIQLFDVPQILTNASGNPNRNLTTLIMYLNNHLYSRNYGMGGAISVLLFILTGMLSAIVFRTISGSSKERKAGR